MAKLIRTISKKNRWSQFEVEDLKVEDIDADAITDLKTESNDLSVWRFEHEQEYRNAIIALASKYKTLDSVYLVIIDEKEIEDKGYHLAENPGETIFDAYASMHRDITGLKSRDLNEIALIVFKKLRSPETSDTINSTVLADWFIEEIIKKNIELRNFTKSMQTFIVQRAKKQVRKGHIDKTSIPFDLDAL